MFKRILFIMSILAMMLTACTGQQQQNLPPTMSPADIQSTAAAAAYTMIAATQMALPTATLVPPTDIPLPSPTPLPTFTPDVSIPTPQPFIQPAQPSPTSSFSGSSSLGECNRILAVAEAGPTYPVRIQNLTGGTITLSLYLNKNEFGQCGYMPGLYPTSGSYVIQLPTGSWYYFALVDYGKGKSGQSYGNFIVQTGGADVIKILKR